ncbi:MAG TPA: hypothetical protein VGR14_07840 [Verrucomicrobiae bacterium]|jgi:hypothetical protein|nr:hypothetical protein [Verrucomicrobiae bacterium]
MFALTPTLNEAEKRQRVECEEIIRHGWETFVEVGRALSTIRDKRLYRDRYGTFEGYCRKKWEFSRTHAYRMIEAAAVDAVLSPIGVKLHSESQARPLAGLAPHSIPAAWKRAEQLAGAAQVTARVVRQAAEEFKHDTEHLKRVATPHSHDSIPASLESAFKLIDDAEEGARSQAKQVVLDALKKLRKCLSALSNG